MDKLKLAHDWAMKSFVSNGFEDEAERAAHAWKYADAMQAEAEKRVNKERPEALLTKDKDGKCLHFHHEFGHKKCMDCGASLEEWQPDWSQAPAWANWWAMDLDNEQAHWYEVEPIADAIAWRRRTRTCKQAPSFDYQGNWQDSLRKRPQ